MTDTQAALSGRTLDHARPQSNFLAWSCTGEACLSDGARGQSYQIIVREDDSVRLVLGESEIYCFARAEEAFFYADGLELVSRLALDPDWFSLPDLDILELFAAQEVAASQIACLRQAMAEAGLAFRDADYHPDLETLATELDHLADIKARISSALLIKGCQPQTYKA